MNFPKCLRNERLKLSLNVILMQACVWWFLSPISVCMLVCVPNRHQRPIRAMYISQSPGISKDYEKNHTFTLKIWYKGNMGWWVCIRYNGYINANRSSDKIKFFQKVFTFRAFGKFLVFYCLNLWNRFNYSFTDVNVMKMCWYSLNPKYFF